MYKCIGEAVTQKGIDLANYRCFKAGASCYTRMLPSIGGKGRGKCRGRAVVNLSDPETAMTWQRFRCLHTAFAFTSVSEPRRSLAIAIRRGGHRTGADQPDIG